MANSVGSLVVSLGLDAAEYTRGLTKAEYQAKQFARNTRTAMLEVGKVLGGLAIGATVFELTKSIIAEAAALDDFADATGSSVEALSKLNNQAKISGTEFATLQTAVLKLSAGMAGTDEETTKAKEALKALGVTTKDPAEAMQQVALSLDKYKDGVNKAGLAVALFGKSGAALLPLLKDMAESQEVQATVTAKQAAEADKLEKSWRALQTRATEFSRAILGDLVPALERLLSMARESGLAGVFAGLGLTPEDEANARRALDETAKALVDLRAKRDAFTSQGAIVKFFSADDIAILDKQIKVAEAREARLRQLVNAQFISRGPEKPDAPAVSSGGGAGRAKALKEATDEGLRYQQSLERQLQSTLDLSHEEEARVAIFDALRKGQAGFTAEVQANILDMAQQLDATKALRKEEEEKKKAAEEAARAQERIAQATKQAIRAATDEVESIKQGNEQLREQIAVLQGGEEAVNRLTDAKLQAAIAEKEATLATLQYLEANEQLIATTAEQIRLLKERQGLLGQVRAAEVAANEAKQAKQFADDLGTALAQGAENAILHFNNLRDVLKGLEQDLLRIITRKLVTQPLGDFLSAAVGAGISGFSVPAFASGGTSRGGWATVGEQGPELVHLPRGAQVIPNDVLMSKRAGRNVTVNINVPSGASRSTIDQTRLQFGLELQRVLDRSG